MTEEIAIRLWLVDEAPNEANELTSRRKLLKPKTDGQTAKQYVQIRGHDAFAVANLVPRKLIQLVTLRHEIFLDFLPKESSEQGLYAYGDAQIFSDGPTCEEEYRRPRTCRQLFATAPSISELKETYELFRAGELHPTSWAKKAYPKAVGSNRETQKAQEFKCPRCLADVRVDAAGIKSKKTSTGEADMQYYACPNCGRDNPIELVGKGTSATVREDDLSTFLGIIR